MSNLFPRWCDHTMSIPDMAKYIAHRARKHRRVWQGTAKTIPPTIEQDVADELRKAADDGWKVSHSSSCKVKGYAYNLLCAAIENHDRWYKEEIANDHAIIHPVLLSKLKKVIPFGAILIAILGELLYNHQPWIGGIIMVLAAIALVLDFVAILWDLPHPYRKPRITARHKSSKVSNDTKYRIAIGVLEIIALVLLVVMITTNG